MHKIAIHSVPRSGSTWLGEILNSSPDVKYCFQPLFSYQFKDFLDESSSKDDVARFFTDLQDTDDDFVCQKLQREAGTLPRVEKAKALSHVVYKEVRYHHILENLLSVDDSLTAILLVRDPIEVMNSWLNAPKEFHPSWDAESQLVTGELKNASQKENFYGLDAWVQTTKLFERLAKTYPKRVLLVDYSSLQKNLEQTTKQIYAFCDLPFTALTRRFLSQSLDTNVTDTYSVFRGGKKTQITLNESLLKKIRAYVQDANLSHYIKA